MEKTKAEVLLYKLQFVYMMKDKNTGDVDLDYLLECKVITKKLYNEMQSKDVYEIVYRYVDDAYPSAGSWWFKNKQERNKFWNEEKEISGIVKGRQEEVEKLCQEMMLEGH